MMGCDGACYVAQFLSECSTRRTTYSAALCTLAALEKYGLRWHNMSKLGSIEGHSPTGVSFYCPVSRSSHWFRHAPRCLDPDSIRKSRFSILLFPDSEVQSPRITITMISRLCKISTASLTSYIPTLIDLNARGEIQSRNLVRRSIHFLFLWSNS